MLLGILCLVMTGLGWVAVGVITNRNARRNINNGLVQGLAALLLIAVSAAALTVNGSWRGFFAPERLPATIALLGCGVTNYASFQMMCRAMKDGRNSVIYVLAQSAMIFPFLMGVIFFDVAVTLPRLSGMLCVIAGVALTGLLRKEKSDAAGQPKSARWLTYAFAAFAFGGATQCLINLPSYWNSADGFGSVERTLLAQAGAAAAFFAGNWRKLGHRRELRAAWLPALLLAGVLLLYLYVFFFRGMDLTVRAGAGAIAFPVAVGTSIIGFFCYSVFALKEKPNLPAVAALLLCLAGITLISLN